MTLYVSIGATAETKETACRSDAEWSALLDALARNDIDAVMSLIAIKPKMLATATLRPLAAEDVGKHAGEFWRKYAERHGAAKPAKHGEVSYSVAPNRADPKTNQILRKIAGGPRK